MIFASMSRSSSVQNKDLIHSVCIYVYICTKLVFSRPSGEDFIHITPYDRENFGAADWLQLDP